MKNRQVKFIRVLSYTAALLAALLFSACAKEADLPAPPVQSEPLPTETPVSAYLHKLRISELMAKNHATLMDDKGQFPDYIEIENISAETIQLKDFRLSDDEDKTPWRFPDCLLAPGEHLLLYAGGEVSTDGVLRCSFALSQGELLSLFDPDGLPVDSVECSCGTADVALCRDDEGNWCETMFPTPGYPNTSEGYSSWQNSLFCRDPLIINEVMTSNNSCLPQSALGYCDWVELKNDSTETIDLSNYWLSDDEDCLAMWQFPAVQLAPGQFITVLCDDSALAANPGQLKANFSLNSRREQLYLSRSDGSVADFVFLHDIPNDCSYGRMQDTNGWFFFETPSPNAENTGGYRRLSASPTALQPDGIYETGELSVELRANGTIHYTLDGSLPSTASPVYDRPISITETTVLRAISVEEDAIPSRPLNCSYIVGEGHSLPVLSLTTDKPDQFWQMYRGKRKDMLVTGSLSFYEEGGSFTIPCGIEMHGDASLSMPKKNMSVKFSGAYGQATLLYDIYGGGVTEFSDLVLRSGQDFPSSIVRNELLENLCLQFSDCVPTQRSRHCVLYINGEYSGLYTLMEKLNREHYARLYDVSADSVTVLKARAPMGSSFYEEVICFAQEYDLRTPEDYERFCQIVDIDSLIDWMIIEGYSVNTDISNGNLRYCRSYEGDGKWRFMLYDMDSTMGTPANAFNNVLMPNSTQCSVFIQPLMSNPDFADRFLCRAGEVLGSTLTDENVVAELDRLAALIAPEVERDYDRFGYSLQNWESSVRTLREKLLDMKWNSQCVEALCRYFRLSDTQRTQYFGEQPQKTQ